MELLPYESFEYQPTPNAYLHLNQLLPLLPHLTRLCFHCAYSQWTILRSLICNLTQLKSLELNIDIMLDEEERDGPDWDDEGEGGWINW